MERNRYLSDGFGTGLHAVGFLTSRDRTVYHTAILQFTKAVEEDQIQSASIQPNQETPTGTVTYQLKDGTQKVTQILDTEKTSELLDDAGVAYAYCGSKAAGIF